MTIISATGSVAYIRASVSFPDGFNVSDWAHDSDPFDSPSVVIAEDANNMNGQRVVWSVSNVKPFTIGVIPASPSDKKLRDLLRFNDSSGGKVPLGDIIEMVITFPNGTLMTYLNGSIMSGSPGQSSTSKGQLKSKIYEFSFESATGNA